MRVSCLNAFLAATLASSIATSAHGQVSCPDLSAQTNAIKDKYASKFDQIKNEGQQIKDDFDKPSGAEAAIGVSFKVDWKDQKWIFDLPGVTMKLQTWSFDTPSVTIKDQAIIFHTPSVRMKTVKCGQYPEIHGFTVRWSDIKCDVPETFMEEQRIIMGVPEFFMERQEIKLDVPEFAMERQEWIMKIPEFTVIDVNAEIGDTKKRGEQLKADADEVSSELRSELTNSISAGFDCYESNLINAKNNLSAQLDLAIDQMKQGIDRVKASGGDPKSVGGNLEERLASLITQKGEQIAKMDEAIATLQAKEREAIDRLNART